MQIRNIVKKLKRKYDTSDPFDLAKQLDIIVIITELAQSLNGYFYYFQRNKIIYINSHLNEKQMRLVAAHELGHALLHVNTNSIYMQNSTFFVSQKLENEANIFAAELLLPEDLNDKYPEYFTHEQVSIAEDVPVEYITLMRLK